MNEQEALYNDILKACETAALKYILLKHTGHVMHQELEHSTILRSAHTVFMCFVFT
jgi:hypothetical protein